MAARLGSDARAQRSRPGGDLTALPASVTHLGARCRVRLPFCPPSRFPAVWEQIRRALVPGAIFAGHLFGTRDSWAADPGTTFQDRSEVTRLPDGLEVLELRETERDGEAYSGPKHWHTYDILARQPAGHAHSRRLNYPPAKTHLAA
jgi:hypothetical protein